MSVTKAAYQKNGTVVHLGDCLDVLKDLPDESVHCCVTSPPYWGLRDYGTATWEGGDPKCDHEPPDEAGITQKPSAGQRQHAGRFNGPTCHKCGAARIDSQVGLESTPDEYVEKMVDIFREIRRVLRDDGTLWLNLGDSYNGNASRAKQQGGFPQNRARAREPICRTVRTESLKTKDLVGIPWRVAFALQSEGWYLRSDIIWHKPNPMPESVVDRPTKSHEYVFLMSKSRRYYYNADAIREPTIPHHLDSQWDTARTGKGFSDHKHDAERGCMQKKAEGWVRMSNPKGRNKRTVWTIIPQPFPEAHFATFPEALPEICIKAGCPKGGVVLDPFAGAGTTLKVARDLGCKGIGIELNPAYIDIIKGRMEQQVFAFDNA